MIYPITLLGTLSNCVYVDLSGIDQIHCGITTQPCRSLSYTINNVSRPNDKICLIASPIKQIMYILEKPIVIKHSLIVTKSPLFSLNPVIIYGMNNTRHHKEFYAFTSFSSADADKLLSLKIRSVNFNVNIFTALYEGKGHPLSLSITDSIISSPNHAVHLTDLSGYENVSIHVKDSIIQKGRFVFKNERKSCESREHIKNIVKMNNITIANKRIVAFNVNGCFNVSISKLKCSNITWKKEDLFMFKGNSLKLKDIVIENIIPDNKKSQGKALFVISNCAMDIENVFIKNCKGPSIMRFRKTLAVFLVQFSLVEIRNMDVIRNSLQNFVQVQFSSLHINNISLSQSSFTGTLCSAQESNLTLHNAKFYSNKIRSLIFAESKSRISIQNSVLINNHVTQAIYSISKKSTLETNNSSFLRNNFRRLYRSSNSSAIMQNNTLTENNASWNVYLVEMMSSIQLNDVTFTRNNFMGRLMIIGFNSSGIIQDNTLTENDVGYISYLVREMSSIQLNDVTFTRNNFMGILMIIEFNSSGIIQNNTLTENIVGLAGYLVYGMSSIRLNDVAFTQNNFKRELLHVESNSSATVKNNTIVGNNMYGSVFNILDSNLRVDKISLYNNTFMEYLMFAISACNISLDLMRISDNRFKGGIIYIKNSTSRLANTYIENYDHFSVSAISVNCAYDGQKCFPFEFTNNIIIWTNKLLFSVRPIIELFGNIIISNVSVSVASKTKIELLRYSTKDVIITFPFYKRYSNVYNISSLFATCTRANVRHMTTFDTVRCTPCAYDTYTLNNSSIKISSRSLENKKHEFQNETTDFTCSDCPVGGNCTEYIKSKSNFYGYKTKQQEVKFLSCPWKFCCRGDLCKTIDSCNKRRTGTLCGRCSKNNTESFLSTNCIPINSCQNFAKFWLIYCVYALCLATFLYYMKESIVLVKTIGSKVSKVFHYFKKDKKNGDEIKLEVDVVGAEEHLGKISHFTVSGIFALTVSFYQVKQVMAVDIEDKNASGFSLISLISKFINLEIIAMSSSSYCPMNDLNAVSKALIKTYLLTVALIMASIVNYFVSRLYYSFGGKLGRTSSLKPSDRLGICFIRVLMLNYKNIASVSLILLNCVEIAGIRVLHVRGDTECFNWWQVIVAVFFFTWILLFPLSLKLSYTMFMRDEITFLQFIVCLMIPLALVVYKFLNRNIVSVALQKPINESYVKRILKEKFEEPYRLKGDESRGETIFYETWRLYQRVLLAIIATFFINPLQRIAFMTPIIIFIAVFYHAYRPYKAEMYILHWIEILSIMGFFVSLTHNMFRGFLYVYDIKFEYSVTIVLKGFDVLDLLFSPILIIVCVFIIKPSYNKAKDAVEAAVRKCLTK